jgi:ubiquinone/menaquinone biosynthesis C-methylase UbiE
MCGLGDSTVKLKKMTQKNLDPVGIIGVDPNPLNIQKAQHKHPDTQFICADILKLGIDSNTFDLVQIYCGFLHLPEKENTIRQIHRILKPDGIFLMIDYDLQHPYIKELQKIEVPLSEKIIDYHPDGHHYMISNIFKNYETPWIQNFLRYNIYYK